MSRELYCRDKAGLHDCDDPSRPLLRVMGVTAADTALLYHMHRRPPGR